MDLDKWKSMMNSTEELAYILKCKPAYSFNIIVVESLGLTIKRIC